MSTSSIQGCRSLGSHGAKGRVTPWWSHQFSVRHKLCEQRNANLFQWNLAKCDKWVHKSIFYCLHSLTATTCTGGEPFKTLKEPLRVCLSVRWFIVSTSVVILLALEHLGCRREGAVKVGSFSHCKPRCHFEWIGRYVKLDWIKCDITCGLSVTWMACQCKQSALSHADADE